MTSFNNRRFSGTMLLCAAVPMLVILAFVGRAIFVLANPVVRGDHGPLKDIVNFPVIADPEFVTAESSKLADSDDVIGVVVAGQAYAFSVKYISHETRHVVNLSVDGQAIAITYCDLVDCARVLTRPKSEGPIGLRIGGLDYKDQLVVMLDGVRYSQTSKKLPLEDFPFERATLGEWKARHPKSLVHPR